MKNSLLFAFLLFSISLMAQYNFESFNTSAPATNNFPQPAGLNAMAAPDDQPYEIMRDTWKGNQWQEEERTINTLDSEGNIIDEIVQVKQEDEWINDSRVVYAFNNKKLIFAEHYRWNGSQWLNNYKNEYSYDNNGRPVKYIQVFGDSLTWINQWQNVYTYNSNTNLLDSYLFQGWDLGSSSWKNISVTNYLYTSDGKDSITTQHSFNNQGDQVPEYKKTYRYTSSTHEEILEHGENNGWVNYSWIVYTYDGENLVEMLVRSWEDSNWKNWYKDFYSYNAQDLVTEQKRQTWNGLGFVTQWRFAYEYNALGNRTLYRRENYNFGDWIGLWQFVYEFDSSGRLAFETRQKWDENAWVNDYRNRYSYDPVTGIVDKRLPDGFQLHGNFPNPFQDMTKIRFTTPPHESGETGSTVVTLKIYNAVGSEITTLVNGELPAGTHDVEFNAFGLPGGIYFCRLQRNNRAHTFKMNLVR